MNYWADEQELESINVGDIIRYEFGVSYLKGRIVSVKVTKITKTMIIAGNERFSRRDGTRYPKDRYVNAYILSEKK